MRLPVITLRQVQALQAVIEHETVTEAARAMNLSQPALSKLIGNLESDMRLKLFDRVKRRLVPTPEAHILGENARRIFDGLYDFGRIGEELRSLQGGRLCVVSIPALGRDFLPACLLSQMRQSPGLAVSLMVHSELTVVDWVTTKQADLGFTISQIDHPALDSEQFCRVETSCVLPIGHRLADKKIIHPEDLAGETFVSFTPDLKLRSTIDAVFDERRVKRDLRVESYMSEQACAFVAQGRMVAIVDPFTAAVFARRGEVVSLPFAPPIPVTVTMMWPRGRSMSLVCKSFVKKVKLALSSHLEQSHVRRMVS
jgi:DNA-binding transcriptional LysR family regulator